MIKIIIINDTIPKTMFQPSDLFPKDVVSVSMHRKFRTVRQIRQWLGLREVDVPTHTIFMSNSRSHVTITVCEDVIQTYAVFYNGTESITGEYSSTVDACRALMSY